MEPLKPIEGTLNEGQGQTAIAVAEVVRNRYWQERAQAIEQTVQANGSSAEVKRKEEQDSAKKSRKLEASPNTYAEFEINPDSHEVIVRIIDGNSGELIRTIPPDQLAKEIANGRLMLRQLRRRNIKV